LSYLLTIITGAILIYGASDMPKWGDPKSPASTHVSPRYIEKAYEETEVPNMVTAILADYRGYDTLGETTVIFTAGIACLLILRKARKEKNE
jgi:multicomponent Na+:H+ antiporter subunit B